MISGRTVGSHPGGHDMSALAVCLDLTLPEEIVHNHPFHSHLQWEDKNSASSLACEKQMNISKYIYIYSACVCTIYTYTIINIHRNSDSDF